MRCRYCHSYIPEGMHAPEVCPNCGKHVSKARPQDTMATTGTGQQESARTGPQSPRTDPQSSLPFLTLRATLAFGLASQSLDPTRGSLSFSSEGISVVWNNGRDWDRIPYRDLSSVRVEDEFLRFEVKGVESKIALFHPWLPEWIKGPRRKRAEALRELLDQVKYGLSPVEIRLFQRRLG